MGNKGHGTLNETSKDDISDLVPISLNILSLGFRKFHTNCMELMKIFCLRFKFCGVTDLGYTELYLIVQLLVSKNEWVLLGQGSVSW